MAFSILSGNENKVAYENIRWHFLFCVHFTPVSSQQGTPPNLWTHFETHCLITDLKSTNSGLGSKKLMVKTYKAEICDFGPHNALYTCSFPAANLHHILSNFFEPKSFFPPPKIFCFLFFFWHFWMFHAILSTQHFFFHC